MKIYFRLEICNEMLSFLLSSVQTDSLKFSRRLFYCASRACPIGPCTLHLKTFLWFLSLIVLSFLWSSLLAISDQHSIKTLGFGFLHLYCELVLHQQLQGIPVLRKSISLSQVSPYFDFHNISKCVYFNYTTSSFLWGEMLVFVKKIVFLLYPFYSGSINC